MFKKGFLFLAANPLHDGHKELMRFALQDVEHISVYIGQRSKDHILPYSIRSTALQAMISYEGLTDQISVLGAETKFKSLDFSEYDLLIAGSDFLNQMGAPFEKNHADFISQFKHIAMNQRDDTPLMNNARTAILRNSSLITYENNRKGDISSRKIREKYRKGESVKNLMPPCVKDCIEKYVSVFDLE
ncbi:MAG: hypothetical protein KAJ91_02830 [Candidatus Aenigmarchaeota archaeon]|nr:hypothetical protein [Candidatus Aenigmarchaeota archaeon]MCK5333200.1 hypothetical protein [Candidatus Aenigmarchaeota archaeon]